MGVRNDNLAIRLDERYHPITSCGEYTDSLFDLRHEAYQGSSGHRCPCLPHRYPSPSLIQLVDRLAFNVLGVNGSFRESAFTELFNPTNTTAPFFQVFDDDFLRVLGPDATIRSIASNPDFAFAHEAPIWLPETDDVYFASLDGSPLGHSDIDHNNQVSKIGLGDVAQAIDAAGPGVSPVNVSFTKVRARPVETSSLGHAC